MGHAPEVIEHETKQGFIKDEEMPIGYVAQRLTERSVLLDGITKTSEDIQPPPVIPPRRPRGRPKKVKPETTNGEGE